MKKYNINSKAFGFDIKTGEILKQLPKKAMTMIPKPGKSP